MSDRENHKSLLTLIENGEVCSPDFVGQTSLLLGSDKILKIGPIDRSVLDSLGVAFSVFDAAGCYVVPGFIDPHEHLLGGSGEKGFATQTPEIYPHEIVRAGITTVVGCLGVDTVMKTMAGLLAKVKALKEEGLNANLWTGGYDADPGLDRQQRPERHYVYRGGDRTRRVCDLGRTCNHIRRGKTC